MLTGWFLRRCVFSFFENPVWCTFENVYNLLRCNCWAERIRYRGMLRAFCTIKLGFLTLFLKVSHNAAGVSDAISVHMPWGRRSFFAESMNMLRPGCFYGLWTAYAAGKWIGKVTGIGYTPLLKHFAMIRLCENVQMGSKSVKLS